MSRTHPTNQDCPDPEISREVPPALGPGLPVLAVPPAEGARLCGVGRTKFYEALGSGDLKSFKLGSRRLIRVAEIDAWLKRLEEAATDDPER